MSTTEMYQVRDPIYGFISFNDWERDIINSPPFQRLRRIQQLSLTNLVYPGAVHNRFEHSLGVMHFASRLFDAIVNDKRNKDLLGELGYTVGGYEKLRSLIRLAALLHDVGHAPFSHGPEELMPINSQTNKRFKHEDYSVAIITGPLKDYIQNHKMNSIHGITAENIAAFIEGKPTSLSSIFFWKELVSSQLDADKGDYLIRDSHHAGVRYGLYDNERWVNTIGLCENPDAQAIILGVHDDGSHVAESVIIARYLMFTQVYFHKTRRAYDHHLKNIFKSFLPDSQFPLPSNIENYLKLDDYEVWKYIKDNEKDEHCSAVLNRTHVRKVYATQEIMDDKEKEQLEEVKARLDKNGIEYIEDKPNKSESQWYKDNISKEIMIIDEQNKPKPLTSRSQIVKNMGIMNQTLIFVKENDKNKAKEIIYGK